MQLDDQRRVRLEPPRGLIGKDRFELPGRPAEKVAVGKIGRPQDETLVAGSGIAGVRRGGGRRRVHANVGVMDSAIPRGETQTSHVAPLTRGNRHDEIAEEVRPVRA